MNSNNRNSMFPFRRGGGKKRSKPQGAANRRQGAGGGGRRIPGSAAELLGTLQPTTKSLAQVLAGNTRASGQIVHARNILSQAERLVDERAVDRLPPKQREEFLEQLARLKLTLADADDAAEAEAMAEEAPPPPPSLSMDRLRALALSIATSSPAAGDSATGTAEPENGAAAPDDAFDQAADAAPDAPPAAREVEAGTGEAPADRPARTRRGDTLRLKTTVRQEATDEDTSRSPATVR